MYCYRVFRRAARNWREFSSARKVTLHRGVSLEQARRLCAEFNDHRTPSQIVKGIKLEFERE